MSNKEWPESLMIRNTGIVHEEEGGVIFTTTGRGYTKHKYVKVERVEALEKAIAIWCRESAGEGIDFGSDDEAIKWFISYTNALDLGQEHYDR